MTSNAKRIDPALRSRIETVKAHIRTTTKMFDGDGYVFAAALRELRAEGYVIRYHRKAAVYTVERRPHDPPAAPDGQHALPLDKTALMNRPRRLAKSEQQAASASPTTRQGENP